MLSIFRRIRYEIDWWRWQLFDCPFTLKWYGGPYYVDKASRDLMMKRWNERQPRYTEANPYPKRVKRS